MRPGHHEPAVGQTWLINDGMGRNYELTIQRLGLGPSGISRAFGVTGGGKPSGVDVSTLRRGMRGSRLVRHADGTPVERPPEFQREHSRGPQEREWKPTVREYRPRGVVARSELTEQEKRILEMRGQGMTRTAIARELGLKNGEAVATREQNARDILAIQKMRAAS